MDGCFSQGPCFGLNSFFRRAQDRKRNIFPSLYIPSPAEGLISCSHAFDGKIHILFASCFAPFVPFESPLSTGVVRGPSRIAVPRFAEPPRVWASRRAKCLAFLLLCKILLILRSRKVPRLPGTNLNFSAGWGSLAPKPVFPGPWPVNPCLGPRSRT
jgi:hypothetical protein